MSSAQAHDRQAIVPFQHQVARIAQPSMNRPLVAIQLPATRTAIRAQCARN